MTHADSPPAQPAKVTPLVRQYNAIKAQYPQHVLMIRMGSFCETSGEYSKIAARALRAPEARFGPLLRRSCPYAAWK